MARTDYLHFTGISCYALSFSLTVSKGDCTTTQKGSDSLTHSLEQLYTKPILDQAHPHGNSQSNTLVVKVVAGRVAHRVAAALLHATQEEEAARSLLRKVRKVLRCKHRQILGRHVRLAQYARAHTLDVLVLGFGIDQYWIRVMCIVLAGDTKALARRLNYNRVTLTTQSISLSRSLVLYHVLLLSPLSAALFRFVASAIIVHTDSINALRHGLGNCR
jgi:hypothetical protein